MDEKQRAELEAAMRAAPAGPTQQAVQAAPGTKFMGSYFDQSLSARPQPAPVAPANAFDGEAFGAFYQGLDQSQQGLIQGLLNHIGDQFQQRQQQMMGGIMGMAPPQMRGYMPMMQAPMMYGGYMPQQQMYGNPYMGGYMPQQQMYGNPYMGGYMPQPQMMMPPQGYYGGQQQMMPQGNYGGQQMQAPQQQAAYTPPQQASPFGGSIRGYYS